MTLDNQASTEISLPDPVTDVPVVPPSPVAPINPVIIQDTVDKFLARQKEKEKEDQGTQMRLNVGARIMQDPAQEGQFKAIANVLGVPVDTVRALPEESLKRARLAAIDFSEIHALYPIATQLMTGSDGGVIAQDAPTVLEMEDIVRGIDPNRPPGEKQAIVTARTQSVLHNRHTNEVVGLGSGFLNDAGDLSKQIMRFAYAVPSLAADVAFELGTWATSYQSFDTTAGNIAERFKSPFQNPDGSPRDSFSGSLAPTYSTPVGTALQNKIVVGPPRFLIDTTTNEQFENPDYYRFGQGTVQRLGAELLSRDTYNMVPQIAAMSAATAIGVTPAMFGGGMGLDRYIRAGQEGADPLTALEVGVGDGLLNMGLMSAIPQFNLGWKSGKVMAPWEKVANPGLTYMGRSMGLATGMTIAGNLLTNLYKPTNLLAGFQDQAVTFFGFELPGYASHTLTSLQAASQRSKLAKVSPEVIKEVMRKNLSGSEYENTMVTTDAFNQTVLLQGGNPREVATRLRATNIDEALGSADGKTPGSGVDLIFPTHELLMADTKLAEALAPHRHTFPDEMTRSQREAWDKAGGPDQLAKLLEAADAESQSTPEYQKAHEVFKARFEAAGVTPEVAHDNASRMADVYYNLSKEAGITIEEAVKYFDPKIVFGNAPEKATLNQPVVAERPGIHISDKSQPFTDQILSGEKTIETRTNNNLSAYIGQRVGVIQTNKGESRLVGFVTVGEPKVYNNEAEFRADQDQHLVAPGSEFDIKPGAVKYGYPMLDPVPVDPQGPGAFIPGNFTARSLPEGTVFYQGENRTGVSAHTLDAEREARAMASRASLTPEEKTQISDIAKEHGLKAGDIEAQARAVKVNFPVSEGWEPMTLAGAKVTTNKAGEKKVELNWKTTPYTFDRGPEGEALKPGSPEYIKRVSLLARNLRDEVATIYQRALEGDANAETILKQAGWYKEMRTRLRHEFGGLGDTFADLLGATSPNTPVRENYKYALDVLRRATRGDFDALIPQWEARFNEIDKKEAELRAHIDAELAKGRTQKAIQEDELTQSKRKELSDLREFPEEILPVKEPNDKGETPKYGFNGRNITRALVDLWRTIKEPDANIGRGETAPKALNFSGNLIGFKDKATIDVWAARLLNRLAGSRRVAVSAEDGVAGSMLPSGETAGQFRFGQDAFSEAVKLIRSDKEMQKRKELAGINDDDLQAVAWFIEKELWTKKNWTSSAGEGGSLELEANLAGSKSQERINELRSILNTGPSVSSHRRTIEAPDRTEAQTKDAEAKIKAINDQLNSSLEGLDKTKDKEKIDKLRTASGKKRDAVRAELNKTSTPEMRAKAQEKMDQAIAQKKAEQEAAQKELDASHRTVDRYTAGLALQQSQETQGRDYIPTDAHQALVQQRLKNAIYNADPEARVMASKVVSTQGRYGSTERALDLEVVAREGYDPNPLHLEMLRQALENEQDSMFLSRVLRSEENHDPTRHRPGMEIYFKNKLGLQDMLLNKIGQDANFGFYTVIMDGLPNSETRAGADGDVVGIRFQYIPEFMDGDGLHGLPGDEIGSRMKEKGHELRDIARQIIKEHPDEVTSALQLWYDTDITFLEGYQRRIDELSGRVSSGGDSQGRSEVWAGRSHAESLADSASHDAEVRAAKERGSTDTQSGAVPGGDAGQAEGLTLFQPETGGTPSQPRGWFRVLSDGSFEIGKTKFGDLSTFIHEPAHSYLYMIKDLQAREGASETLKADWRHILTFLGSEDGNFTEAQHEKWASANEEYFNRGVAPTPSLAGAFQRIAIWMHSIYEKAVVGGVELTPEITGVFDRMYAGRDAVDQAKQVVNSKPMFATAEDMGISQAHFDLYASKSEKAVTTAQQAVIAHLQRDFQREHQAWWKDESSKLREQITEQVKADPVYRAINAIKDGKLTVTGENGATWTVDIKLNRQMIIDQFGEEMIKKMPKGTRDYKGEGTMDAEGAAEVLGFKSGTELMNALTGAEPEGALIKRLTHEQMVAKHGDMLTDGTLTDAAVEAMHNQAREEMLQAELKALRAKEREMKPAMDFQRKLDAAKSEEERAKVQAAWEAYKADQKAKASQERQGARDAMELPPTQALKEQAQALVDKSSMRDLEPFRYLLSSRKNSRDSFEAMGNKDYAAAAKAKQFEIMNHHLYLAATAAKIEAAKIYKYGKLGESDRFQGMLGKAGGDFQSQWNALASRYEFRQVTNKELDTRQSLGEWMTANAEDGATIDPSILLDGPTKNWREVPMSELRAVRDGLKNIETVARHQLGYDLAGKKLVFDTEISAFEAKARENNSSKTTPRQGVKKTALENVTSMAQGFNSYMQKLEWFIDQLDGGDINGPARKNIKAPIDDASGREKAMADVIKRRLMDVFSTMSHSDRLKEYDSVGVQFPSMDRPMNRMQLFSWALNLGTEENRKVAIMGEGLMGADGSLRPEFDAALSKLTAAEARRIQGVWDALESLKPEIIAKERRTTGIEPKWKKLTPFTIHTVDGETIQMAGGYYPLKADHNISSIGRRQMDPGIQEGTFTRPTVSNSHTKEVTGATYPVLLDYPSVLSQHLPAVIKNVTMGEAISYVSKFIMNDTVGQTIRETLGLDKEKEFLPWLQSVAGQGVDNSQSGPILRFLMSRRMGMVIARLGGNITSYLVQGGDSFKLLPNESPALLTKHLPQAIYDIRTNPKAMIEEIRRLSPNEMAFREENSNREIRDMLTSKSPVDEAKQRVAEFLMTGFMVMDRLQTFPAWLAKYREGLTTHGNEQQAIMEADRLIATTFQAGEARNMARVMREPGMVKLFTTFQGDANTWYGLLSSAFESKDIVRVSTALMALFAEQAVTQSIRGRLPQKDDQWGEWSLEQALSAVLNPLGIFGDLADYGVKKLQGKYAKFNNPTLDAIEKMFTLPAEIHNYATGKHDAEALSIATLDAVGMWSGIPLTGQIVKSWKYQHGIRIGTQPHPQSALEEIKNTLLGPPPKEKP